MFRVCWWKLTELCAPVESGLFKSDSETVRPLEANAKELSEVHTKEYLDSLGVSCVMGSHDVT